MSIEPLLDPDLRAVLAQLPEFPNMAADPPVTRKWLANLRKTASGTLSQHVNVTNRTIDGPASSPPVPVRIYSPTTQTSGRSGCLLWIHGGGFILGDLDQSDALCGQITRKTGCVVVSGDYRFAPESPFPAAPEDCYAALEWIHGAADELQVDPELLAVGGASAGGGLAAALALMARDRRGPRLNLQLLIYPMLDDRDEPPSRYSVTDRRLFYRDNVTACWNAYLSGKTDDVSPYAAPSRAEDLSHLPPAYVMVAERDNLLDEDIDYARRLIRANVNTELHMYPGAFHAFDIIAPTAPVSLRATANYTDAIKRAITRRD